MTANAPQIRITVLTENTAKGRGILAEHGMAYWIETPNGNVLFDTGQGNVLQHNANTCGIDLRSANAIVLSHGHYDHTGGLCHAMQCAPEASVYFHPDALLDRFTAGPNGRVRRVNVAFLYERLFASLPNRIVQSAEPTEILPGLFTTGSVPRTNDFEDTGGAFFLDAHAKEIDPINDDQSLFFHGRDGTVLILGCAHAGVVNTLHHTAQLTGSAQVHTVIGGMHLLHASAERLDHTFAALEALQVQQFGPCHCTGIRAIAAFWNRFPNQCIEMHAGRTLAFPLA